MDFSTAEFETSFGVLKQLPESDLPEIVFSGKSNVGKSSLLNKLFQRKSLARVSSVPGKTVTINFFRIGDIRMVDLPGYGYAKVAKTEKKRWSELMEGYFNSQRNIKLVVQLVDMRHPPSEDDRMMIDYLTQTGYPFIVAMTKSNKLNKTEYRNRLEKIKDEIPGVSAERIIPFSAQNGEGTELIKDFIIKAL